MLKRKELACVQENLNTIKNEIELYALSVNEIINKDNLKLKIEKNWDNIRNEISSIILFKEICHCRAPIVHVYTHTGCVRKISKGKFGSRAKLS